MDSELPQLNTSLYTVAISKGTCAIIASYNTAFTMIIIMPKLFHSRVNNFVFCQILTKKKKEKEKKQKSTHIYEEM